MALLMQAKARRVVALQMLVAVVVALALLVSFGSMVAASALIGGASDSFLPACMRTE